MPLTWALGVAGSCQWTLTGAAETTSQTWSVGYDPQPSGRRRTRDYRTRFLERFLRVVDLAFEAGRLTVVLVEPARCRRR
jgi:hypothetical protein